jgi:hydrogen cyanide synthase HcnC
MSRTPEIIVVGGGVIGCAVTYELAKRRRAVLLLDQTLPGRATSASAGGLWPIGEAVGLGCGVLYHAANGLKDGSARESFTAPQALPEAFRDFLIRSNACFPELAVQLRELSGLDIEYVAGGGLLFVIQHEAEGDFVQELARTLPARLRPEILSQQAAGRLEPNLRKDILGAARFPGEHQVNPMLLAEAFKRAALALGATFQSGNRAIGLRRRGSRIIGVETAAGFLPAVTVVNAAGAWSGQLAATVGLALPVFPVRGQIVLTDALPRTLNGCLSTSACYLLQKAHGEILIGSTTERSGFDVATTPEAMRSLIVGAVLCVPLLRSVRVKRTWAGLRPGTPDELPVLGPVRRLEGYFNATGGFRTGIVAAPLTGRIVAEWICGENLAYPSESFLMDRFSMLDQQAAKTETASLH